MSLLFADLAQPQERAAVVIDVAPGEGDAWFAEAIAGVIAKELARFSRVRLVDKTSSTAQCPKRTPRCVVNLYGMRGVDIVVLGALRGGTLDYEVHETWSPARAARGSVAIEGTTSARLEQRVGDLVRPITASGGLLDTRPTDAGLAIVIQPVGLPAGLVFGFIAILAALLCLPVVLLWVLVRTSDLLRQERPSSWLWSGILVALLLLVVAVSRLDWRPLEIQMQLRGLSAVPTLILPLVGGVLWGTLALIVLRFVFSPIAGLSNVRQGALWPVLAAWFSLAVFRALMLTPFVLLLWAISLIEHRITWILLVPGAGLLAWFWLMALADNLTTFLDLRLVVGPPSTKNAWHAHMRRYFLAAARRSGVSLDPAVLRRALFLPGTKPGVHIYGGGFARPRIVVGEQSRELALGELPDELVAPERTVNPEEMAWGLLSPSPSATPHDKHFDDALEVVRKQLGKAMALPEASMPRAMGENTTVVGWLTPRHDNAPPPLAQKAGGEHTGAFEKFLTHGALDDIDPSHKDFLFGALVGAVGDISRGNAPLSTLRLCMPWLPSLFASPATRVSDTYVALNHTLHPLLQYLHQLGGGDKAWLTARASGPALLATSERIVDASKDPRVRWLAHFFRGASVATRRTRAVVIGSLALVFFGVFFALAKEAIAYHHTYTARMAELRAQANGDTDVRRER
ncbi:MAG: hypothetical protein IT381_31035 [Deltaproteobacteria bacterium]|nr:hypothetical protein [Deltaproteobacteria bacterium]